MKDAQNEITEKCYLIKNDISVKNEITARVAAEFAVTFYQIFKDDFDEKKFLGIVKRVMEFFNRTIVYIPKRKLVSDMKKILDEIDSLKDMTQNFSKISVNNSKNKTTEETFTVEDVELCKIKLKELKKELKALELNKPFFLFRWKWKKSIKNELIKLNSLEEKSLKIYDNFYEKNKDRNEMLEEIYLDIRKNLKDFMKEIKPTIGEELVNIPYEHVVEGEDELKSFVFDVVISNFYQYYTLREKN